MDFKKCTFRQFIEAQVLQDSLSDEYDPGDIEAGDELIFSRPGIQRSVLRKLRRGQPGIEKELDLHGLTVDEARTALASFLHNCKAQGIRCARIIHGKGHSSHQQRPVLKGKINSWLRQKDEVLAFCSARPIDGGTGAVYVLLKLQRK